MKDIFILRLRWWSTGAVLVYLIFAYFHFRFGYYFWGQAGFSVGNDDAFITFRYAKNLIEHGILSFNPGDDPPVEGFSNPLYLLVSTLTYLVTGVDMLYPTMAALGGIAVAIAIICLGKFAFDRHGAMLAVLLMFSTALCPTLWIQGSSGLESAWVFLAQVLLWTGSASYSDQPSKRGFGLLVVLSAILVLLRTDGFVMPFFVAMWLFWRGHRQSALSIVGTCLTTFFLLMAARLAYYGLPMPLTYYVKVSGELSARLGVAGRLIASIALKNGMGLPLIGILASAMLYVRVSVREKNWPVSAPPLEVWLVALLLAYYLYIGGDIYRDRFLMIIFPMGTYALFKILNRHASGAWISLAGVSVMVGQLSAFNFDARLSYEFEAPKYDRWIVFGRFLEKTHPDWLLAVDAAGKIPYFSGLETIDILGLNNRHIAMGEAQGSTPGHNKFDPDYVLSQQPDIICSHLYGTGDLTYGLDRATYEAAGFALRYLVISRGNDGPSILDLSELSFVDIPIFLKKGYRYGCLINSK